MIICFSFGLMISSTYPTFLPTLSHAMFAFDVFPISEINDFDCLIKFHCRCNFTSGLLGLLFYEFDFYINLFFFWIVLPCLAFPEEGLTSVATTFLKSFPNSTSSQPPSQYPYPSSSEIHIHLSN